MSYLIVKSPAALAAATGMLPNCGGGGAGQELVGGTTDPSTSIETTTLSYADADKIFRQYYLNVTIIVFSSCILLASVVFFYCYWLAYKSYKKEEREEEEKEEQSQFQKNLTFDKDYLLQNPVKLYKTNEKVAEDGNGVLVKAAEKDQDGQGKGDK